VPDGREALQRPAADALSRAVRGDQLGVLRLERRESLHHPVVFAIADLRLGLDVVQVIVPVQLAPKLRDLALDRLAGHGRSPTTAREGTIDPGGTPAGRSIYPRSAPRFDLDLGANQRSVSIASTPDRSMITNSTPRVSGPFRSNHSASATELGPGRGRAGSG